MAIFLTKIITRGVGEKVARILGVFPGISEHFIRHGCESW